MQSTDATSTGNMETQPVTDNLTSTTTTTTTTGTSSTNDTSTLTQLTSATSAPASNVNASIQQQYKQQRETQEKQLVGNLSFML